MNLIKINDFVKEIKQTKNIDIKKWKDFIIEDLFEVGGTTTTSVKKIREKPGEFPYVTTQATNNGVRFYSSIHTEKGNVLVVDSAVLGWMSYQERNFSASDHVEKLTPKFNLNKERGLFITSVWNAIYPKNVFDYKKKASQKEIKKCIIPLPIDEKNQPNWDIMESYVKNIYNDLKDFDLSKLEELPKKIKDETIINISKWKKFQLTNLFDYERGRRYKKADHKQGEIAYISSSAKNNGIDNFVSPPKYLKIYKHCLTIANSGSVGKCFYHDYEFVASDHVHVLWLKNKKITKKIALFLITSLEQNKNKFMFNKEISERTIKEIEIFLPVKNNNEPNWDFIELYIKNFYKNMELILEK